MRISTKLFFSTLLFLAAHSLSAQYGPRLFLDAPGIYAAAPDVKNIANQLGLGADINMNIATHNAVLRFGGGSLFTVDPKSEDLLKSFLTTPYVKIEAGAGRFRSNGNKCARTHRPAYTAIAKVGARYNFFPPKNRPEATPSGQMDYTAGVELGYFYIRDIIKKNEIFLNSNYNLKAKTVSAELGLRVFFNLRGRRD